MVNFLFEKWVGVFVRMLCLNLCAIKCKYICICAVARGVHINVCLRICWYKSLHIYTYFRCLLLGSGKTKEEGKMGWGVGRKWIVAIKMIFFS